jgi:hypothetical protein
MLFTKNIFTSLPEKNFYGRFGKNLSAVVAGNETFFVNQLNAVSKVFLANQGDFLVDNSTYKFRFGYSE